MAEVDLTDSFSLDFTLYDMAFEEFLNCINQFENYINNIYFYPPAGDEFYLKPRINSVLKKQPETINKFYSYLEKLSKKNIRLNLCLDTFRVSAEEKIKVSKEIFNKLPINSIKTVSRDARELKNSFPECKLICSSNQKIQSLPQLKKICKSDLFDGIIISAPGLRNKKYWKIIDEHNLDGIFLLNKGCSHQLPDFNNSPPELGCEAALKNNLNNKKSLPQLYARQSIFPGELHKYIAPSEHIDGLKLATIPFESTLLTWDSHFLEYIPPNQQLPASRLLQNCLKSYIENSSREYISESPANYYLWATCDNLYNPPVGYNYNITEMKPNQLIKQKENLWNNKTSNL